MNEKEKTNLQCAKMSFDMLFSKVLKIEKAQVDIGDIICLTNAMNILRDYFNGVDLIPKFTGEDMSEKEQEECEAIIANLLNPKGENECH